MMTGVYGPAVAATRSAIVRPMSVVPPLLTLFVSIVKPGVIDVTEVTVFRLASTTKSNSLSCAVVTVGSVHGSGCR